MKKHLREEIQLMQKKRPYNVLKSDIKKRNWKNRESNKSDKAKLGQKIT